ncbi:DEAD/DEAH box helicase family protein [Candidatus Saccharibacteria bacterium]|nr:DEAD/DEAH box helicase family protein [Candidatus Saccharibacteria bacterium]
MARPRDYQKECISALTKARAGGKHKALVVMASGLGKTLTAIFDVKNYLKVNPAARVLMLCHSADILRQTKEVFKTEFGDEYSYGLYNGQEKACRKTDFLFANLQSVDLHKEDFDPQDFDYIIVDEAHHSAAPTYGRNIEYFEPDFILGLTATPDRMDGQKLDQFFGDEPVYSKDLIEAIREGLLSDIDYYVEIDEENRQRIREIIGEDTNITYADIDGLATNNYTANEDVVAKIHEQLAKMEDPTTVIFCQTIEHADAIHALMPDESAIVYSKYDSMTNDENITKFRRGNIKTIITVNMFNEGIDIPRTDVVVFLRVTQSKTIFLQQLGRGLRKAESKEKVVVMDFVGTGARIRQIMDFEGQFSVTDKENKKPGAGNSKGGPGYGYFNLHLGGHESYEDVGLELIDIMSKVGRSWNLSDDDLIEMLRKLAREIGHTPTVEDVNCCRWMPNSEMYMLRFNSFNKALIRAGLNINHNTDISNDEMLEKLRWLASKLGHVPTIREVNDCDELPSSHLYAKRFGDSYTKATIAAGFNVKSFRFKSNDELLDMLREFSMKIGKSPTLEEVNMCEWLPSCTLFYERFKTKSWNDVLKIAGLKANRRSPRQLSDDKLLALLKKKADSLERAPTKREVENDPNMPSTTQYRRFGGWNEALLKAGVPKELIRFKNRK